jgi:hypothetical protein
MNNTYRESCFAFPGLAAAAKATSALLVLSLAAATGAMCAENGGSVYPTGVDTVTPGFVPPSGKTLFLEFNNFYQANGLMDGSGHSLVPGFHLRVAAVAPKVVHNWGVKALGGFLVSSFAVPVLYEHLTGPFGNLHKTGIGNSDLGVLSVAYAKGDWHWWYGVDVFAPGNSYKKDDVLNVGQHYFSTAPVGAVTYVPLNGKMEFSSRLEYIVNFTNPANQYRTGHQFVADYAAMHRIAKKLSVGLNGYVFQQTSDDRLNNASVPGGERGRAFAAGPQIKLHVGEVALILKYQKEMFVQNRAAGNSFWLMMGIPLWHPER